MCALIASGSPAARGPVASGPPRGCSPAASGPPGTRAPAAPGRRSVLAPPRPRLRLGAPRFDYRPAFAGGSQSVVAEAMRFVGAGNVTGMRGAWCADYASMILRRTGHHPLAGRSVSAAFAYGPRVSQPRPGDLVVINTRAGYAQHVGFFAGWITARC